MSRRIYIMVIMAAVVGSAIAPVDAAAGDDQNPGELYVVASVEDDDSKSYKIVVETEADEARGWLGVSITEIDEKSREKKDIPSEFTVVVTDIHEDSPADEAGIREGDVIVEIEGERVADVDGLIELVKDNEPGAEIEVVIYRDGEELTKTAVLGVRPSSYTWTMEELGGLVELGKVGAEIGLLGAELGSMFVPRYDIGYASKGRGKLGVYVDDLGEELAEYFEVPGGKGVLVEGLVEDGPAEKAGIRAGDVIIRIGETDVGDTSELVKAIGKMEFDTPTAVEVVRKGERMTFEAAIPEPEYREHKMEFVVPEVKVVEEGGKRIIITDGEKHVIHDEEELQEALEELKEELEELREELEEMKEEND